MKQALQHKTVPIDLWLQLCRTIKPALAWQKVIDQLPTWLWAASLITSWFGLRPPTAKESESYLRDAALQVGVAWAGGFLMLCRSEKHPCA